MKRVSFINPLAIDLIIGDDDEELMCTEKP